MTVKERNEALAAVRRSQDALLAAREALESTEPETLTVRDFARQHDVPEANLDAFEEALGAFAEVLVPLLGSHSVSPEAVRRAALLAVSEHTWELEIGPTLTSAQVREVLGDVSRQRVDELLRTRRLIGLLDKAGRRQFPAFQFQDGRPQESLIEAFWTVADGYLSDWSAASWCVSADDALDGLSPVRWVRDGRDPERLLRVAQQDAARLAQ